MALEPQLKEDVWIPTSCNMCFNNCSIKVHRVDGIVVKIEGNTDTSAFGGKVCGKAASGIMQLYDPSRRTKPMKRTNPEKGIGIDPGWQEISWDEAYSIMAEQIQKALKKRGPDNLCQSAFITNVPGSLSSGTFFGGTLGARNYIIPDICGAAIHGVTELLTSGCNAGPDYAYTKYVLQFGSQAGIATRHGFNMTVKRFADARMNGARYVNVDPRMSAGAEKADRWVPIRPGTDAAMALAIACVLIHELHIYDREYLKTYTNAASLVDVETGRIVRQEGTNKPYVWDQKSNSAKVFDDPRIGELALDGSYQFAGKTYKTGFQMYADHVKTYTPESAEKITTVPAATIRQVAKEFGEAACIGSTIELEGKSYPYRPACADSFSGISRHKHGFLTHWAIYWLNVLVGSANVPGGLIAFAAMNHGYPETGQPNWRPGIWEEENLVEGIELRTTAPKSPYRNIRNAAGDKGDMMLFGLQPFNGMHPQFLYITQRFPERYHRQKMDFLFVYAGNPIDDFGNRGEMGDFLKSFEFVAGMDLYLTDSSYFYDLYLPEATYLERYDYPPTRWNNHLTNGGVGVPWSWGLRQPVVPARADLPGVSDFFNELARRMGITSDWNQAINRLWRLSPETALSPDQFYSFPEILDRVYRNWFGPSRGLEWFKEHGVITYPRTLDEIYLFPQLKTRVPLYFDFMLEAKEKVTKASAEAKIPWDVDDYQALPDWKPCVAHEVTKEGYDLFPIYYTNSLNVDTWQLHNPWINEINENDPYGYNIEINTATAKAKRFKSGDRVTLKAENGYEVSGRLILVEGLHPECLAVGGGCWDSYSEYQKVGRHKGTAINHLLEVNEERMCHVSGCYDQCIRVKLNRA